MKKSIIHIPALLGLLIAGCRSYCPENESGWCDPHADIPAGAIPQPAGTHSSQWHSTQTALADRDDFVVYQYEWQADDIQLSPFGKRHVATLANRLVTEPEQIRIEPSEDPALDSERREQLVTLLTEQGLAGAEHRVVVSYPAAEGLHGREAPRASNGYLGGGRGSGGLSGAGQNSFGGGGNSFGGGGNGGFGGGGGGFGF
jgi:hypothetical protein